MAGGDLDGDDVFFTFWKAIIRILAATKEPGIAGHGFDKMQLFASHLLIFFQTQSLLDLIATGCSRSGSRSADREAGAGRF